MTIDETFDNKTVCAVFGVANMGGIRVNRARNHIVLISNPGATNAYRNRRDGNAFDFVGRGSVGSQKLSRQNATLAKSKVSGTRLYYFEVTSKGRYAYRGEVELAGEPYIDTQRDAGEQDRLVWIFPLTLKKEQVQSPQATAVKPYLRAGVYATINAPLNPDQRAVVDRCLDEMRANGISLVSQCDVDVVRYETTMARWYEKVLDLARSRVRKIIRELRTQAKARNAVFGFAPDEVAVPAGCSEQQLQAVLDIVGRADEFGALMEEARNRCPMPEPPNLTTIEPEVQLNRRETKPITAPKDYSGIT
jgi:hypothetical protein